MPKKERENLNEDEGLGSDMESADQRLRRYGYRIHSRPNVAEAVWEKNGVLFSQREAIARVAQDIKSLENQYSSS